MMLPMTNVESVTYASGDGHTTIPGYVAMPAGPGPHPAVLILRGVAGPDDGYIEIAERLAGWGYAALLHGWKVRGDNPTDGPVYDDLRGAMTFLRTLARVDQRRLGVFGFCRGGVHALMAARAHAELSAIVIFHGFAFRPTRSEPGAEPYDLAADLRVPMLVLHGTEDEQAPIEGMHRMRDRLRALGKPAEFTFFDGIPHGFAVRTHPGFRPDAARRSFEAARRFVEAHLPRSTAGGPGARG